MKKVFALEDLDCANCAAKMEAGIKKLPGVKDASMSFMTQKLTLATDISLYNDFIVDFRNLQRRKHPQDRITN